MLRFLLLAGLVVLVAAIMGFFDFQENTEGSVLAFKVLIGSFLALVLVSAGRGNEELSPRRDRRPPPPDPQPEQA